MSTISSPPIGFQEDLLRQLSNGPSAEQQLWLSGYLYGIATARQSSGSEAVAVGSQTVGSGSGAVAVGTAPLPTATVTVLFGSQTGNSKKAAAQLATRLRDHGRDVQVHDLNDYPTKSLKDEKIVLLVVSTQGEGDPPVSAEDFHKWLHSTRAPRLDGVQFAVCALGDKSYLKFCQTGKEFDARFEALGAQRLVDRLDCDVEFEDEVAAWAETVVQKLPVAAAVGEPAKNGMYASAGAFNGRVALTEESVLATPKYDRKHPFAAEIFEKVQLNGRGSTKETWHLELSLADSGLTYQPGDALGIYPQNPPSLVKEVLYAAMLNGDKKLIFNEKEDTFRNILLRDVELTVLNREVLERYATWTNNAKLKALIEDTAALKRFLWGRNVADLLREYPAAMSEATLLSFLRKMPPRLYSIASSLEASPDEVHLTVAAVRYDFNGRSHLGAASTYLANRVEIGDSVPVFLEHNEYFKLPEDDATDILMVGPGTGVAPFRAFVAERAERGATGKNWLFFGNPHFETDFLYQTEWLNHLKRGTLDRLDVAFSRDQTDKIYVQHRLAERAKLIFERLENGAHFYVCGDKDRMASDVQQAVLNIVAQQSGKGDDYAAEYLKNLKKQRRYLEDVY